MTSPYDLPYAPGTDPFKKGYVAPPPGTVTDFAAPGQSTLTPPPTTTPNYDAIAPYTYSPGTAQGAAGSPYYSPGNAQGSNMQGVDMTQPGAAENFYSDNQGKFKSLYGDPYVSKTLANYDANGAPKGTTAQSDYLPVMQGQFTAQNGVEQSAIDRAASSGAGAVNTEQGVLDAGRQKATDALTAQRGGLAAIGQAGSSAGNAYAGAQDYTQGAGNDSYDSLVKSLANTQAGQQGTGQKQLSNMTDVSESGDAAVNQELLTLNAARQAGQISDADYTNALASIRAHASGAMGLQVGGYGAAVGARATGMDDTARALDTLTRQGAAATGTLGSAITRINRQGNEALGMGQSGLSDLSASRSKALDIEQANYDKRQADQSTLSADPNFGDFYDNAIRRSVEGINKNLGARGAYGSSAADDQIKESITNLNAERANREADYNLQRSADARAWADSSTGAAHTLAGDTLGFDTLGQGALSDLLKNKQGYDTSSLAASGDLGKLELGYSGAESSAAGDRAKLGLGYDTLLGDEANNIGRNTLGFDTLDAGTVNDKAINALGNSKLDTEASHALSQTGLNYDTLNSDNTNKYADTQLGFTNAGNTASKDLADSKLGFSTLNADTTNKAQTNALGYSDLNEKALNDLSGRTLDSNTLDANSQDNITKDTYANDKLNVDATHDLGTNVIAQGNATSNLAHGVDTSSTANNQLGLDTTVAMGNLAQGQDNIDLKELLGQGGAAVDAQNAQRNRGNDAVNNQLNLANAMSGVMGSSYDKMQTTDLDVLVQQLAMQTGTAAEGYSQATRDAAVAAQNNKDEAARRDADLKLLMSLAPKSGS